MSPSPIAPLGDAEESLWRTLAHLLITLPHALDEDLRRETGLTMADYGVLMNLSEASGHRLRMSVLAGRCDLSGSRMSRLVDELRQKGYVTKDRSVDDGRGNEAVLTAAGLVRLQEAYPAHLASVRCRVLDHVRAEEILGVVGPLDRISDALQPSNGAPSPDQG